MDTVHNAITEPARRLEVFTGAGRRRLLSDEDKARSVQTFRGNQLRIQSGDCSTYLFSTARSFARQLLPGS
jgi:hypothetical protein